MALESLPMEKLQPSTNGRREAGPVAGIQPETSSPKLLGSTGDGGDEKNAIALLEAAGFAAEEADVFFVEIDVEELANLTLIVAHVSRKIWEPSGKFVQSLGDGGGATVYFWRAVGEAAKRCGDFDDYWHFQFSLDEILLCSRTRSRRAELSIEVSLERVEARGDRFGSWKFGGDGIGGFQAVPSDADHGGFLGLDEILPD